MAPRDRAHGAPNIHEVLQTAVLDPDLGPFDGQVLDLTAEVVAVSFGEPCVPICRIGESVDLQFTWRDLDVPIVHQALVRSRSEMMGGRRYDFAFSDWRTFWSELPAGLRADLNQRGAVRVTPRKAEEFGVTLIDPAREAALAGSIVDISATGALVSLPAAAERQLASTRDVTLSFELPGDDGGRREVRGRIRHRRLATHAVQYGVAFDFRASPRPKQLGAALRLYVANRQRDLLDAPRERKTRRRTSGRDTRTG